MLYPCLVPGRGSARFFRSIELGGKKVLDPSELPRMVAFGHIGKTVTSKVIRKGNPEELRAVIEVKPEK